MVLFSGLFDDSPSRKRIPKATKDELFRDQAGRCMYCGRKLGKAYLHVDHKTPLARGGSDRTSNLQLICQPCNTRKGPDTNAEFRRRYKLTLASKANGPPNKIISQKYFEDITKEAASSRAKQRRRERDDWWWSVQFP